MLNRQLSAVVLIALGPYLSACGSASDDEGDSKLAPRASDEGHGDSSGAPADGDGTFGGTPSPTDVPAGEPISGVVGPAPGSGDPTAPGPGTVQSGVLTAGTWDDNRNYGRFQEFVGTLEAQQLSGMPALKAADRDAAHDAFVQITTPHETLDVALVVDTTGSMGDEIRYLQTEFLALSDAIQSAHPNSDQRWSLVVYRDLNDEYVTRKFDFDGDVHAFQGHLAAQSASGGGDTPEAADAALAVMNELSWRPNADTAKLAFWVADAPHHADRAAAVARAIEQARSKGVHVYPVAASGVDDLAELTMRSAAQLTGGRYIFLTNDSGIGNDHKEPLIPCYFVTRLDSAILRMVDIELGGVYREPAASDIIRKGGDPHDGECHLESGNVVQVF